MSKQDSKPFAQTSDELAALAMRANRLALETAETAFGLQLGNLQRSAHATGDLLASLSQGADPATLLPQSLDLARQNIERMAGTGHQLMDLGLRSGQALAQMAGDALSGSVGGKKD
jgi:hypothetical protein